MGLFKRKETKEIKPEQPKMMYKTLYIITQKRYKDDKVYWSRIPAALPSIYEICDKNEVTCVRANPTGEKGFQYEIVLYGQGPNILNFMRKFSCEFCNCFMLSDNKIRIWGD